MSIFYIYTPFSLKEGMNEICSYYLGSIIYMFY